MSDGPAPLLVVSGPSGAGKTTVARGVAAAFDLSAHVQADHFTPLVVSGWVQPELAAAAHQNDVLGGAIAAAALELAHGGYTVLVDGHFFPDGVAGLAPWCERRSVPLHYAVLRPDLGVCLRRAAERRPGDPEDVGSFTRLHARYGDLGDLEAHVVDAMGTPEEVVAAVLDAFGSGRLRVADPGG